MTHLAGDIQLCLSLRGLSRRQWLEMGARAAALAVGGKLFIDAVAGSDYYARRRFFLAIDRVQFLRKHTDSLVASLTRFADHFRLLESAHQAELVRHLRAVGDSLHKGCLNIAAILAPEAAPSLKEQAPEGPRDFKEAIRSFIERLATLHRFAGMILETPAQRCSQALNARYATEMIALSRMLAADGELLERMFVPMDNNGALAAHAPFSPAAGALPRNSAIGGA